MDRKQWRRVFGINNWPAWVCPVCHTGVLSVNKTGIVEVETVASKRSHAHQDWDPTWIERTFSAWLKCSRKACGESISVVGISGVDPGYGPEGEMEWEEVYSPKFLLPAPDILSVPKTCPDKVTEQLRAAFSLYWSDSAAAANRLRIALEELLDFLGIKRRRRVPGEIQELTLHQRLKEYEKTEPVLGAQLIAVKWLGNTASHESGISHEALLDALEIVEHVLAEILENRSKRIAALAKKLTDEHAPRKKRNVRKRKGAK